MFITLLLELTVNATSNGISQNDPLKFLQTILVREDMTKDARAKKLEVYLKGLNKQTYLKFIRTVDKSEGVFKGAEDRQLSMFFFARWYLESAGKKDNLLTNINIITDNTLPWCWRWSLLDILKLEEKRNLTVADIYIIRQRLYDAAKNNDENGTLRYAFMQKTASLLLTQLELQEEKIPKLKKRIITMDNSVLVEKDIKNNIKLLTTIKVLFNESREYEKNLQTVYENTKDPKLKTQFKALLKKWQSLTELPINN